MRLMVKAAEHITYFNFKYIFFAWKKLEFLTYPIGNYISC